MKKTDIMWMYNVITIKKCNTSLFYSDIIIHCILVNKIS